MKRIAVLLILMNISDCLTGQVINFDNAVVYAFRIEKNAKRQFRETNYWITKSDTSSFTRLDFREIYDYSEILKCSKGDTLNFPFAAVWESYWLKEGAEVEKEVFGSSEYLIQNFRSDGEDVSVFRISMSGQFCKCSFRDSKGEVIPLYMPLKEIYFTLTTGINPHHDLSRFEFHFFADRK